MDFVLKFLIFKVRLYGSNKSPLHQLTWMIQKKIVWKKSICCSKENVLQAKPNNKVLSALTEAATDESSDDNETIKQTACKWEIYLWFDLIKVSLLIKYYSLLKY